VPTLERSTSGWAPLLQIDADLASRLPEATVAAAAPFAVAPTEWIETGDWSPAQPAEEERSCHLGLLVVDGFIARRVRVLDRPVTELLGRGDLILPWEPERTEPFAAGTRWEVLEATCVAVLDRRFTGLLGRWPELTVALLGRAIARTKASTLSLAISQIVGIELRLLVLLWHIAERWGAPAPPHGDGNGNGNAAGPRGIVVPVRLTHEMLASLISAQRPTVTRALRVLAADGRVTRRPDGVLVVHGEPPSEFRVVRSEHAPA
jgi:CRP/FNR family transcriptional regulator, cyclic AMP receptor protein